MCTKHETNGQIPKTYVSNSTVCYYASMQWSYATFGFCENGCTRSLNAPFRMWKSESAQLWKSAIFLERQFQCTCKNRNEMDRLFGIVHLHIEIRTQTKLMKVKTSEKLRFFLSFAFYNTWPRVFWIYIFFQPFSWASNKIRNNFTALQINKWVEIVSWPSFQIFWRYFCINYSHIILSEWWLTQVLSIRPSSQNSLSIRILYSVNGIHVTKVMALISIEK